MHRTTHHNLTHALLGGLSPAQFLRDHWQKKPSLIRRALTPFVDLLTPTQLMDLASREQCRSRIAMRQGREWEVLHGPFTRKQLRQLPARGWALLVQDVDLVMPQAHELLSRFNFIPYARQDDLMVSLAPDGGGVGPHFDSYDVFLLQGHGTRRWELSTQSDLTLVEDAPLKVLKRFKPTETHVLSPGDMLYLPPNVAHNGIALEECMTYSVGFRSPSFQELVSGFLAHLEDESRVEGLYQDADLEPTRHPARVPHAMLSATRAHIGALDLSTANVTRFLGRYLTEPQSHVVFSAPEPAISRAQFAARSRRQRITLDLRTRMLWSTGNIFINGEHLRVAGEQESMLRRLADHRRVDPPHELHDETIRQLHEWYRAGYLLLVN